MKISIPKYIFGTPIEGALERALNKAPAPSPSLPSIVAPTLGIVDTPKDYIILPGKTHGPYSYDDLVVAKHRLGYSSGIDTATTALGMNRLSNTAEEKDGIKYIGNINWETALKLNQQLGNITLNPRQFIDFLDLLQSGKAFDGTGAKMQSDELTAIYNEIREVREPWRSEWLDAKFTAVREAPVYMEFEHRLNGSSLGHTKKEEIKGYVSEDGWIDESSFNDAGLPTKKSRKQTLYFWAPVVGTVAGFGANSGRTNLYCCGIPTFTDSGLGVRAARAKN